MDSMHKHLSNKCPVLFPKDAQVAISSGVVMDFEIVTMAVAAHKEDSDSSSEDDTDKGTAKKKDSESSSEDEKDDKEKGNSSDDDEDKKDKAKGNSSDDDDSEEEGESLGMTRQGTICKYCVKKQGRCHLHTLK
jgi:hypothetical protein